MFAVCTVNISLKSVPTSDFCFMKSVNLMMLHKVTFILTSIMKLIEQDIAESIFSYLCIVIMILFGSFGITRMTTFILILWLVISLTLSTSSHFFSTICSKVPPQAYKNEILDKKVIPSNTCPAQISQNPPPLPPDLLNQIYDIIRTSSILDDFVSTIINLK